MNDEEKQALELARAASCRYLQEDRERVPPDVAAALGLIEKHLFEPGFGRADLIRLLGPGGHRVARRFRGALGEPVTRYITVVRLTGALQPLVHTDLSLESIAGLLGWDSPDAFGKAFRRTFGQPASEARQSLRTKYGHLDPDAEIPSRVSDEERQEFAEHLARELGAWLTTPSRKAMLEDGRIQLAPMVLDLMDLGEPN